jgi:hypothetical protein
MLMIAPRENDLGSDVNRSPRTFPFFFFVCVRAGISGAWRKDIGFLKDYPDKFFLHDLLKNRIESHQIL